MKECFDKIVDVLLYIIYNIYFAFVLGFGIVSGLRWLNIGNVDELGFWESALAETLIGLPFSLILMALFECLIALKALGGKQNNKM